MTTALKEIVRLWVRQKRHDFHWKNVFIALYFGGLYLAVVLVSYFALREELAVLPLSEEGVLAVPLAGIAIQLGDLVLKLLWRRSPVEMDDYLRTRPVSQRDWSRFMLMETAQGFMQWLLAVAVAFPAALLLSWWAVVLVLLLCFSVSLTNALFQNCWRRAPGNEQTLPLVFGYLVWTGVHWGVGIGGFVLGVMQVLPVLPAAEAALAVSALLLLLHGAVCWFLHRYFTRMKNHNEEVHVAPQSGVHSLGQVSVWSIEWVQLLRSKRLRTSVLVIAGVFLLNTYMQQPVSEDFGFNPMLFMGIAFPSIILAQWVLGIEANYFAFIWTRPLPVEGILRRKYLFFCAICCLLALLILPCVVWLGMSFWAWLSTLLFGCGCFVLPFMATCLYSSRMDLFASAFFNYQGGNKQLNIFSLVMFIPIGIYFGASFLLSPLWSYVLLGGLGLVGLALHRTYIHWISSIWHKRRYDIMERWLTE